MVERIPPHNEEAERSVLGAVMLNKDILSEVLEEVTADDFYNESHREIFRAIWELYKENTAVDMLTVCEELKKRKAHCNYHKHFHSMQRQIPDNHCNNHDVFHLLRFCVFGQNPRGGNICFAYAFICRYDIFSFKAVI